MTTILPVSLATAAAAALLNIWLAWRVGQVRRAHGVSVGDGGNIAVVARMRAHANFAEFAPIILVLLALLELAKGSSWHLWLYGAAFVVARTAHGVGMDSWKPGRAIGVGVTLLLMLAMTGEAAWTALNVPAATPPLSVDLPATG